MPLSYFAAGADDTHPVAEGLDLGEDVAGQQHGAPLLDLADAALEGGSISGSNPEVGSSRISSLASEARAAMSATFWRLPLE